MFEIHGHRGCRGLMPENTIAGVKLAMEMGVHAVEIDVVVSRDKRLVVSHEPWMSSLYCLKPNGDKIDKSEELSYNLFEMDYDELALFDCGSLGHPEFPDQRKEHHAKPCLKDLIRNSRRFAAEDFYYNIEVKSQRDWYGDYQPEVTEYCQLLCKEIKSLRIRKKCIVQSFDPAILNTLNRMYPDLKLSMLVENDWSLEKNLDRLQFTPAFYNPDYRLTTPALIKKVKAMGLKIIPWTVNDKKVAQKLQKQGVDGIITDYPNYFLG